MNKQNIWVILVRIFLILLVIYFSIKLISYNNYKKDNYIIKYKLINIIHHKGSRGNSHITVNIKYNNINYEISINKELNNKIINNDNVNFYYNYDFNYVFSEWQINLAKRKLITSIIILLITFIPFNLIKKYLDKKYEEKQNLIK